jgi:integrase
MPKLPKGIFIRRRGETGGTYYTRRREGDRRVWVALGDDLEIAKERMEKLHTQGSSPRPKATVRELALRWLQVHIRTRRIPRNVISTTNRTDRYLLPFLGDMMAHKVTKDDLRSYRLHLEGKGLGVGTVRGYVADACCLLRWAEDSGYLDRAPIPKGLLPVVQEEPPKRLTDEEAARVVALPDPLGFACLLLLLSGMRWGEVTRAKGSDISKDGILTISTTKSRKVRRVPLPPSLAAECRQRGFEKLLPWARPCSDYFNRKVAAQAKVPGFHAHRLRHTFSYRWIEAGGSLAGLQRVLGHATLDMTLRYVRADEAMVYREAERVHQAGGW